jgi:hypothetical protein
MLMRRAMSFMGVCVQKEFQFAALVGEQMLQRCGLTPAVIKDRVLCAADNDFSIRTRTMQFD